MFCCVVVMISFIVVKVHTLHVDLEPNQELKYRKSRGQQRKARRAREKRRERRDTLVE